MADEPDVTPDDTPDDDSAADEGKWKDGTEFDAAKAAKALEASRKAERRAAKEADELRDRLKRIEDAEKTELDRALERISEFEKRDAETTARLRRANLRSAVADLASDLGLASVNLTIRALDDDAIDWDGDNPSNVRDALVLLIEQEPALKASGKPARARLDAAAGGTEPDAVDLTPEQLEWAKKLGYENPAEYKADLENTTLDTWQKSAA